MIVFHHHAQVLEVPDAKTRARLWRLQCIRRAVILQLDDSRWLVHARDVRQVLHACARAGVTVRIHTYGE
ncbi:MAG: hypothetical protein N2595_04350 [bacterium]|nr:hypothetical protein [bacterium]